MGQISRFPSGEAEVWLPFPLYSLPQRTIPLARTSLKCQEPLQAKIE
jgi:hypothetical protein